MSDTYTDDVASLNDLTVPVTPDTSDTPETEKRGFLTGRVLAWSFWDWGSAAFNAVIVTFVFSVYLTNADLFGEKANTYYGWTISIAGIIVALVAPAIGQWTDKTGKRRTVLNIATAVLIVLMALLFIVKPGYLWIGLIVTTCRTLGSSLLISNP